MKSYAPEVTLWNVDEWKVMKSRFCLTLGLEKERVDYITR